MSQHLAVGFNRFKRAGVNDIHIACTSGLKGFNNNEIDLNALMKGQFILKVQLPQKSITEKFSVYK